MEGVRLGFGKFTRIGYTIRCRGKWVGALRASVAGDQAAQMGDRSRREKAIGGYRLDITAVVGSYIACSPPGNTKEKPQNDENTQNPIIVVQ